MAIGTARPILRRGADFFFSLWGTQGDLRPPPAWRRLARRHPGLVGAGAIILYDGVHRSQLHGDDPNICRDAVPGIEVVARRHAEDRIRYLLLLPVDPVRRLCEAAGAWVAGPQCPGTGSMRGAEEARTPDRAFLEIHRLGKSVWTHAF